MNIFNQNHSLITSTDSYKVSHPYQYPEGTEYVQLYIESRGGEYPETMVLGQNFISRVLERGITMEDVDRAEKLYKAHFGFDLFRADLWRRIVTEFNGILPVKIEAVPEGTIVPTKFPVMTVVNTHKDYYWLPGHLETFLLRAVWYPSTVATISYNAKKAIKQALNTSSDLTGEALDFCVRTRLHDFGARGVSSSESAMIGGAAHLMNFIGTDTVEALIYLQDLYDTEEVVGISIPAREHSTTISYGSDGKLSPDQEDKAFLNSINQWGSGVYACVMDSVDFEAAVERVSREYGDLIKQKNGTFVFRPDSGNMYKNIEFALETLAENMGYTVNSKGYKVLHPSCRIIQGDSLNTPADIEQVLNWVLTLGYSAENIAFGMGGGLLQHCDRDTQKWAAKASAIYINGEWKAIRKCPKGAEWKASKAGYLTLVGDENNEFVTHAGSTHFEVMDFMKEHTCYRYAMRTYVYGSIFKHDTLTEVRANAGF